jgi:hypothetical protein
MAPPKTDRAPEPKRPEIIPLEAKPPEMISVSPAPAPKPVPPPVVAPVVEAAPAAGRKLSDWKMSDLISDRDQTEKSDRSATSDKPDEPKS